MSASSTEVSATLSYNGCVETSGTVTESISGSISFAEYLTSPEMIIYAGDLNATVTPPGTTTTIQLNYAIVGSTISYSVEVSNGNVLVSDSGNWNASTNTGSFTVVDHSGTWSCTFTNGTGSCSGPNGQTVSGSLADAG